MVGTPAWAAPPEDTRQLEAENETEAETETEGGQGDPLPSVLEEDPEATSPPAGEANAPTEPEGPAPKPKPVLEPSPQVEVIRIAVGLGGAAPGTAAEKEIVDELEAAASRSSRPRTVVRRLRLGSSRPRAVCREGRDDLIILVDYLPDRPDPVLDTFDCRLGQNLGVRGNGAASDPDLVTVLWAEHRQLVADGAKERQRLGLSPKVRTALIAGGAAIAVGAALALLLAGTLRQEVVVLKVSP